MATVFQIIKGMMVLQVFFMLWMMYTYLPYFSGQDASHKESALQTQVQQPPATRRHAHRSHEGKSEKEPLVVPDSSSLSISELPKKKVRGLQSRVAVAHRNAGETIPADSRLIIDAVLGPNLPISEFADLRYRSSEEVRGKLKRVFRELPEDGFLEDFKNPCWHFPLPHHDSNQLGAAGDSEASATTQQQGFACLPYAYVLGQPKCGTSDLFERLKRHPEIKMPQRKEVRWFTRGEFSKSRMLAEDEEAGGGFGRNTEARFIGTGTSIFTFTSSFSEALHSISAHPSTHITIDGGPHTFWWPTQSPDGTILEDQIPAPQMIREIQPNAKFLITLTDPVKRTYSDYYFLDDNLKPVRPILAGSGAQQTKSAAEFHQRVVKQVADMEACIEREKASIPGSSSHPEQSWFRASQICAHDRHTFGIGGWGRLSIGLYVLYYEKWLEHFSPSQFLVLRLEDYSIDPHAYMQSIIDFLDLSPLDEEGWVKMTHEHFANENHNPREPIMEETEALLRKFYAPYNKLLATFLNDPGYLWSLENNGGLITTLRDKQLQEANHPSDAAAAAGNIDERKRNAIMARRAQMKADAPRTISHEGNQHGMTRHMVSPDEVPSAGAAPPDLRRRPPHLPGLRGNTIPTDQNQQLPIFVNNQAALPAAAPVQTEPLILKPASFSIDGLPPAPAEFGLWLRDQRKVGEFAPIPNADEAASQLCLAAFSMDIAALKYLLYDVGLPNNIVDKRDGERTAFHCLSMVHVMADAHSRSQVFAMLKGHESWLTQLLDPPVPLFTHSVLARDIIDGLNTVVLNAAKWLHAAGIDYKAKDVGGNTALHHACVGGQLFLIKFLLSLEIDVNVVNKEGRTPLHYALAYGHAEAASLLLARGAEDKIADSFGATAFDIMSMPGSITAHDSLRFFNVTQRPPKKIERLLNPELHPDKKGGWRGGTGGWGEERLQGFETDMHCDIDQYWAHEIQSEDFFTKYIARNAPVLIRGLIDDWGVIDRYSYANLTSEHGDLRVQVSDIPYSVKFGGVGSADMMLSEYIDEVREHRLKGGNHPWYVFKGHPVPSLSEAGNSLVRFDQCPTPQVVQRGFEALSPPTARTRSGAKGREIFINAQWAFGGEGTGAPVHFHNSAWNALVYGAKKWIMYPPHSMIMSNRQILDYFETDLLEFATRGVGSLSCVQTAGDVMMVPESYGHGVLNLQESVAIATESRTAHWRVRPASGIVGKLPFDNRNL